MQTQMQTPQTNEWQMAGQKRELQLKDKLMGFKPAILQLLLVISGNYGPKNAPKPETKLDRLLQSKPWPLLMILDQMMIKFIKIQASFDKDGKKQLRDLARVSISKAIADAGLDLDQVVCYGLNGRQLTRRDLILHPFFERKLITGIKANFKLARQNMEVPEWKSIYVRRHEGQKPDLVVELRFNPNFHRQLVAHLPTNLTTFSKKKVTSVKSEEPVVEDYPALPSRPNRPKEESPVQELVIFEPLPEGAQWADYA